MAGVATGFASWNRTVGCETFTMILGKALCVVVVETDNKMTLLSIERGRVERGGEIKCAF